MYADLIWSSDLRAVRRSPRGFVGFVMTASLRGLSTIEKGPASDFSLFDDFRRETQAGC